MNIQALVTEFTGPRAPGWLVLAPHEVLNCAIDAARFYAGYGDIRSISGSDTLPGAPDPANGPGDIGYLAPEPASAEPVVEPSLPIKSLGYVNDQTVLSMGEWALIRPLFVLYAERENAMRLEASRAMGLEVYGRSASEIASDIAAMESPDGLPARAFCYVIIEVS
jgi:hypothetical protein